jgi:hypothetical protein
VTDVPFCLELAERAPRGNYAITSGNYARLSVDRYDGTNLNEPRTLDQIFLFRLGNLPRERCKFPSIVRCHVI